MPLFRLIPHPDSPPKFEPEKIDSPVREDPEQAALAGVDFGDAAHAGAPSGVFRRLNFTAGGEDAHAVLFDRRGENDIDFQRQ